MCPAWVVGELLWVGGIFELLWHLGWGGRLPFSLRNSFWLRRLGVSVVPPREDEGGWEVREGYCLLVRAAMQRLSCDRLPQAAEEALCWLPTAQQAWGPVPSL